jgi:hypothetical protein
LRPVSGHSGQNQFDVLLSTLQDYNVVRKLGAVVADNASPNNTLCEIIESYMLQEEDREWSAKHWRVRCSGHIINLAMQAFLFANIIGINELESYDDCEQEEDARDKEGRRAKFLLMGPLGKIHNIVVYIRSSPARSAEFVRLAGRLIPLDNRTRWNSWFSMLLIALDRRTALEKYCQQNEEYLEDDELTPEDWRRLRTINDFLEPFQTATLYTEGDCAAIDRVLFTMDVLIKHFQLSLVSTTYCDLKIRAHYIAGQVQEGEGC